jgi:hypothetical protein
MTVDYENGTNDLNLIGIKGDNNPAIFLFIFPKLQGDVVMKSFDFC